MIVNLYTNTCYKLNQYEPTFNPQYPIDQLPHLQQRSLNHVDLHLALRPQQSQQFYQVLPKLSRSDFNNMSLKKTVNLSFDDVNKDLRTENEALRRENQRYRNIIAELQKGSGNFTQ